MKDTSVRFLYEISDWFVLNKMPQLAGKIEKPLKVLEAGGELEEKWKKLFGFMLFSYSMHKGPIETDRNVDATIDIFQRTEDLAAEIGVTAELIGYAEGWINHSEKGDQK